MTRKTLVFWVHFLAFIIVGTAAAAEPKGAIVAVGGGKLPTVVRSEYIALAGGAKAAKIVVIPTASTAADDPKEHEAYLKPWKDAGVGNVVLLHTRDTKEADTAEFVKPLADATGIWFSGGDQSKLTKTYAKSRTLKTIRERYEAGAVVGGTSAGAAVMSDVMISGGQTEATLTEGFGFLTMCVIDQHFTQRKREARLNDAVSKKPGNLGIGLDESTAIIVRGGIARVLGEGNAHIVLGGTTQPLVLKSGSRYDYQKRTKLD